VRVTGTPQTPKPRRAAGRPTRRLAPITSRGSAPARASCGFGEAVLPMHRSDGQTVGPWAPRRNAPGLSCAIARRARNRVRQEPGALSGDNKPSGPTGSAVTPGKWLSFPTRQVVSCVNGSSPPTGSVVEWVKPVSPRARSLVA